MTILVPLNNKDQLNIIQCLIGKYALFSSKCRFPDNKHSLTEQRSSFADSDSISLVDMEEGVESEAINLISSPSSIKEY